MRQEKNVSFQIFSEKKPNYNLYSSVMKESYPSLIDGMGGSCSFLNKLFVCLANEGTGAAFSFGGLAVDSLLIVELFVAFGAFHFAPKEDAHDGSYGSPVLDVLKEGIEFGGCHSDDG